MSSPRQSRPDPFWLCHECGAQMRPIRVGGVPHCASCNGEFIEILDTDVNPDPFHDLPPAPPVRPLSSPSITQQHAGQGDAQGGGGIFQSIFNGLFGEVPSQQQQQYGGGSDLDRTTSNTGGQQQGGSSRTWTFNTPGGGQGRVMFGSFGGGSGGMASFGNMGSGPQGGGMVMGPFGPMHTSQGNPGGLEDFFPGFAGPRPMGVGARPGDPLAGQDLLRAIMAALHEDGAMPSGMLGPQGRATAGDYVMSQQGFDQILEQLMHAAGPQGPLPASETVIEGLPRFNLDAESLEKSQSKDCPICQDDFAIGDQVMRIPCKHIFHPDCLVPWLKTNGSCPSCRFSLVPADANRRPQTTAPPPAATAPDGSATQGTGIQSALTSTLNRLFGQGGAPNTPTATVRPQPPSSPLGSGSASSATNTDIYSPPSGPPPNSLRPSSAPSAATADQPPTTYPPPAGPPPPTQQTHSSVSTSAPAEQVAPVPSAIPDDYRERHRRREREQNPYVDDLD